MSQGLNLREKLSPHELYVTGVCRKTTMKITMRLLEIKLNTSTRKRRNTKKKKKREKKFIV